MNNNNLRKFFERDVNKTLSLCCRVGALFMLAVLALGALKVFKLSSYLYPTMAFSIPIMMMPTLIYNILHREEKFFKYIFLTLIVVMSGFLYTILSYHVIIMLVFPVVVSVLYCDKKSVIYVSIISVPVIIIAHFIAFYLHIVPDEPLVTLRGVILYGILPRLLEYGIITVICTSITSKIKKLILDLEDTNNQLYEEQEIIVKSLCEIEEVRSYETGKHVKRVSEYTKIICRALSMSDDEVWKVGTAAMLHDIGKILVPRRILSKPGKLSVDELEMIRMHPIYGYKMLEKSEGEVMKTAAIISYMHHERFDGLGYPNKLKGEEINLYARVVAVVDVFDALVSWRSYKKPWSLSDAKDEIKSQAGLQFDPKIVSVFLDQFDKIEEIYHKYPDAQEELNALDDKISKMN